jgi:hypothetical protein
MRWQREKMWAPIIRISRTIRRLDPASYQPQQFRTGTLRPPLAVQIKRAKLCAAADRLLVADAKRRFGKRQGKRVQNLIVAGRYRR